MADKELRFIDEEGGKEIVDYFIDLVSGLKEQVANLDVAVKGLPVVTDTMKKDGKVYALVNGAYDDIAPSGYEVVVDPAATAQSLVLESLEKGMLVTDGIKEENLPQVLEEMRSLLGDELFNEFAANSVRTMELHPVLSFEEKLERAKAAYYASKAENEAKTGSPAVESESMETGKSDVEPLKGKTL